MYNSLESAVTRTGFKHRDTTQLHSTRENVFFEKSSPQQLAEVYKAAVWYQRAAR